MRNLRPQQFVKELAPSALPRGMMKRFEANEFSIESLFGEPMGRGCLGVGPILRPANRTAHPCAALVRAGQPGVGKDKERHPRRVQHVVKRDNRPVGQPRRQSRQVVVDGLQVVGPVVPEQP